MRELFNPLPRTIIILYLVWNTHKSRISLIKLLLILYMLKSWLSYNFTEPPFYSEDIEKDINELILEDLIQLETVDGLTYIVITDKGRKELINFVKTCSDNYVLIGHYLVMKCKDLLEELRRVVNVFANYPFGIILSQAFSEYQRELEKTSTNRLKRLIYQDLSRILSRLESKEGILG